MKKYLLLTLLLGSFTAQSQTYLTNVTVVDVEKQRLLPKQTVVISGERITQMGSSSKIKLPSNAQIIDGKDKYLAPGLTDAHVHFFQSGGLYTRPDAINLQKDRPYQKEIEYASAKMEENLKLYLRCGITQVVDVGATYNLLKLKDNFKNNPSLPSVCMSGPLLTTYIPAAYKDLKEDAPFQLVQTTEEAKNRVQEQLAHHPDIIKIWYIVNNENKGTEASARSYLPIIRTIIDEAHKNKVRVAVHATERITAQLAVENGADFLVHNIEDEIVKPDFIQLLKNKKTILCPTLTVAAGYDNVFGQKLKLDSHDFIHSDAYQLGTLTDLRHLQDTTLINAYKNWTNAPENLKKAQTTDSICKTNLKKLADAGVIIATGTDAGNIGTLHASSYLSEIRAMKQSGLTNWQILTASTLNGARAAHTEQESGSIVTGKKANLILLNANPLDNIENLAKIEQVILNGNAYRPEDLIKDTPETLVQRQLNAYNARDIEAFLEPYAEDVEIYTYPDRPEYKGKETMRKQYADMFQKVPNLHCELKARIVQGNIVIDKEKVQFGKQYIEASAMYQIENGKIKKVIFID